MHTNNPTAFKHPAQPTHNNDIRPLRNLCITRSYMDDKEYY